MKQQYLPDGMEERSVLTGRRRNGYEKKIKEHMEFIRSERRIVRKAEFVK